MRRGDEEGKNIKAALITTSSRVAVCVMFFGASRLVVASITNGLFLAIEKSEIDAALHWPTTRHEVVVVGVVEEHGVKKHGAVGPVRHRDVCKPRRLQNLIYDTSSVRVVPATTHKNNITITKHANKVRAAG
jgi:hypothetical protein